LHHNVLIMKKNNSLIPQEIIVNKILFIRGEKVMLDRDLADLYDVDTRDLNKAVKRNPLRFPNDFMFQLSKAEFKNLMFQIGTSSWGGIRKLPYVFTEQGIAMLSSVLNSRRAILVNIQIMRTFIKLKKIILSNKDLELKMEQLQKKYDKHDQEIQAIFSVIKNWIDEQEKPKKEIGFRR